MLLYGRDEPRLSLWPCVNEVFSCCLLPHPWFSPCTPSSLDSAGPCKWPQALLLLAALADPEEGQGGWGVSSKVRMGGLASVMGSRAACPAGMPGALPYPIQAGCSQVCVRQWLGALAAAWSPVYMEALASFISGRAGLGYFWHKSWVETYHVSVLKMGSSQEHTLDLDREYSALTSPQLYLLQSSAFFPSSLLSSYDRKF